MISRGRKNGKHKAGNWKTYNKGFAQNLHDEIINDMFGNNSNKRGFQNGAYQNVNIKIGANGLGFNHNGISRDSKPSEDELFETISRLKADLEHERSRNMAQQVKIKYF